MTAIRSFSTESPGAPVGFDARNETASGLMRRVHGVSSTSYSDYGLATEFAYSEPEPATFVLLGSGLMLLGVLRRRKPRH